MFITFIFYEDPAETFLWTHLKLILHFSSESFNFWFDSLNFSLSESWFSTVIQKIDDFLSDCFCSLRRYPEFYGSSQHFFEQNDQISKKTCINLTIFFSLHNLIWGTSGILERTKEYLGTLFNRPENRFFCKIDHVLNGK